MRLSLRARLVWLAALSAAAIVLGTTYLETGVIERTVESEALDAASATALGVAADLTERDALPTPGELEDLRIDFTRAVPTLRALTVVKVDGARAAIDSSTEAQPHRQVLHLALQATSRREITVSPELPGRVRLVAVPLEREHRPYGAVVATLSMEAVGRVRQQTRFASLIFAPAAILLLTAAIDYLARRLIHRPLTAIHDTMSRASAGDMQARAPVLQEDELGTLARGLNAMLDQMAGFSSALQEEVQRATAALQDRNRQLLESNQRLFAARRELAKSEQLALTGKMAASMAHEIGTPLNLISGYVQMMLEETPPESAAAARLRTVQAQIRKVAVIVQGLLDEARLPLLHRAPVHPADLVSGVCELARPTLDAAGIALETEIAADLPRMEVDLGQMEQVLLNLITNSIDAMPRGGRLTVSARPGAGAVEFAVADTGEGIPPADLERVFDPLFTTKRVGKGTGLGLTIVRDVLAAHGGSVGLSSVPGQGTTVTVRVPAAAEHAGAVQDGGARA
jgi:two-component system NtrC family sensor kinase